jgi:hypothetical protein
LTRELARRFGPSAADAPLDTSDLAAPAPVRAPVVQKRRWTSQWSGLAAAASVLISLGSAIYFALQTHSLRGDIADLVAREREQAQRAATPSPAGAPRPFLVLPEQTLRSSGGIDPVLAITERLPVALHLQLPEGLAAPGYGVVVRRVGGRNAQVWGEAGLVPSAGRLVATIPAGVLTADDYAATVSTADGTVVADYRFRVP